MALTDSLVAYWNLNESSGNASDSSGSGFTLTNFNTVGYSPALIANGADFGAANTNKRLAISNNLGIDGGAISISGWAKCNAEIGSGGWTLFVQQSDTANVTYYIRYAYNGGSRQIQFNRSREATSDLLVTGSLTMGTSSFYHFVLTYDGSTITAYVNGTSIGTNSGSGSGTGSVPNGFAIGAEFAGGNNSSTLQDEVGVWSRALTGAEVTSLYNGGNGFAYPFVSGPANLKTWNGIAKASVKTIDGITMASIKSIDGIT